MSYDYTPLYYSGPTRIKYFDQGKYHDGIAYHDFVITYDGQVETIDSIMSRATNVHFDDVIIEFDWVKL